MSRKVLAAGAAVMMALAASGTAFAWPEFVEGRPEQFEPGGDSAYYIWHTDESGWHLSTTGPGPRRVFRAVIRTDGEFEDVDQLKLDPGDSFQVEEGGHRLVVTFVTFDHTDNIRWRIRGGEWLHFGLAVDGHPIRAENVYLGHEGVHPPDSKFSLHR